MVRLFCSSRDSSTPLLTPTGQHEPAQPEGAMPPDFADAFQVPPLSDPRDDQVMIGQNLLFDDVQLDQMMPGMILDNSFDTTWLSQVSF